MTNTFYLYNETQTCTNFMWTVKWVNIWLYYDIYGLANGLMQWKMGKR